MSTNPPDTKRRKRSISIPSLAGWILTLGILAAWFVYVRPQSLGGHTAYVIVSGQSMLPALHDGDMVVVFEGRSYRSGDVVAYRVPEGEVGHGRMIIHRITGGTAEEGYVVKGDNRQVADLWRPKPSEIAGSMVLHVPKVGKGLIWLRTPLLPAFVASIVIFFAVNDSGRGKGLNPISPHSRRGRRTMKGRHLAPRRGRGSVRTLRRAGGFSGQGSAP